MKDLTVMISLRQITLEQEEMSRPSSITDVAMRKFACFVFELVDVNLQLVIANGDLLSKRPLLEQFFKSYALVL